MKSLYNRIITPLSLLGRRWHWFFVTALIALFFGLGISSMSGNSAIVDEVAHIPAAYSYLHFGDYRLNPEHPPLIKDLAGIPLQFMHLKFPSDMTSWTVDANEWDVGWNFIYHLGNNANAIIFWARLPILLLASVFGFVLYRFCKIRWGKATALLALFFYCLSPNIIAHSTLVTTDLGASVFIFLGLVGFIHYVEKPSRKTFFLLSLALAGACLAKDSGPILYAFEGVITLGMVWFWKKPISAWRRFKTYTLGLIGASALSVVWIWLYYIPHVINMPDSMQDHIISQALVSNNVAGIGHFLMGLNNVPLMKPLVQYLLGLTMVFGRVAGGNVTYFNGQITNGSYKLYFPEMLAVKTQVAFLILALVIVGVALWAYFRRRPFKFWAPIAEHIRHHLTEWTLGLFALFYFGISVAGNLNLGIRHILPIYIPLFILVAVGTVKLARRLAITRWRVWSGIVLGLLLVWYGLSTIIAYPSYISYFNELIGGPGNANEYFSDSGVDWGQDLLRLKTYVQDNHIKHIAIDYFGGGDPRYYFCDRTYDAQGNLIATAAGYDCSHSVYENWHSQNGHYPGQYIAVSETYLENDRYYAQLDQHPGYGYLRAMKPVAKIGYSIYVYKLY